MKSRCKNVSVTTGRRVISAHTRGGQLGIKLDDGSDRRADHALLATGYRVDINRYPFLGRALLNSIRQMDGYPELNNGFESSIPGLHFLGAPAAWSFGPLMRFVAGAGFASRALSRKVLGRMAEKGF